MPLTSQHSNDAVPAIDPLLPWLRSISQALTGSDQRLTELVSECVTRFKDDDKYRNDVRFLKIWFLHMDSRSDFEKVFEEMMERKICVGNSLLYEWYAAFLEIKGRLEDAYAVYRLGLSRKAEPVERLKEAFGAFLQRMREIVNEFSFMKVDNGELHLQKTYVNPWSTYTLNDLMKKINLFMPKYNGYHSSSKPYNGKVPLNSLKNSSRNKLIEIGGTKYHIKGCAGKGGFAQVYKAHLDGYPDEVVALKIQKPPFPWEFYMYRLLDQRITGHERAGFGLAHKIHLYSDCSILICDYLAHGTLHDAINSYAVIGKHMEEELCIYYTIEMLYMLETLHGIGIIHGDFKPDNLLIRYARDPLTEDGFREHKGPWCDQGLCLVDWGRAIDLHLFPDNVEFEGDCRTSGFRCVPMQEKKPWKFQVDTYGLCASVHLMLHNNYLEIQKTASPNDGYIYQPKASYKRYWNVVLWKNLFTKLLNPNPEDNANELLQNLRESFQDYMCSRPQLLRKLKELLAKQRTSLCSA